MLPVIFIAIPLILSLAGHAYSYDYCQASHPTVETYSPLKNAELVDVKILARHGDRTQHTELPSDVTWTCGFKNPTNCKESSQLTTKGANQMITLGTKLRAIYVDKLKHLPESYSSKSIYARSTNTKRTVYSILAFFYGLYPPKLSEIQHFQLNVPSLLSDMLSRHNTCKKWESIQDLHFKTTAFQNYVKQLHRQFQPTAEGFKIQLKGNISPLLDAMYARKCHQHPWPVQNTAQSEIDKLFEKAEKFAQYEHSLLHQKLPHVEESNRLNAGEFVREIKQSFSNAIVGVKSRQKAKVYLGHDDVLMSLLALFRYKNLRWPPYASNLILELWKSKDSDDGGASIKKSITNTSIVFVRELLLKKTMAQLEQYRVRILYNGEPLESDLCDFKVKGCLIIKFFEIIDWMIVYDYVNECAVRSNESN